MLVNFRILRLRKLNYRDLWKSWNLRVKTRMPSWQHWVSNCRPVWPRLWPRRMTSSLANRSRWPGKKLRESKALPWRLTAPLLFCFVTCMIVTHLATCLPNTLPPIHSPTTLSLEMELRRTKEELSSLRERAARELAQLTQKCSQFQQNQKRYAIIHYCIQSFIQHTWYIWYVAY